jgi:serine phosphatase RsbU (regulator of sigma subunit)
VNRLFFLFYFICVVTLTVAQKQFELNFKNIEPEALGLQSIISGEYSKKYNFIWLFTNKGLGIYNGYYYRTMVNPLDSTNKPLKISLHQLYEDKNGHVWFSYTDTSAITKFSYETKTFTHYVYDSVNKYKLPKEFIASQFYEDSEDRFWIPTWGGGLLLFDRKTEKFKTFDVNYKFSNGKSFVGQTVRNIFEIEKNKFVISFFQELPRAFPVIYDLKKNTITEFPFETYTSNLSEAAADKIKYYSTITHTTFFDKENQIIWFGGYSGVIMVDLKNKISKRVSGKQFNDEARINLDNVQDFIIDHDNNLWCTTSNSGIMIINRKTLKVTYHKQTGNCATCVGENGINNFTKDKDNNIWVFSASKGLSICAPYTQLIKIKKWEEFDLDYENPSGQSVPLQQMLIKQNNKLYMSSAKGISVYDFINDSVYPNITFGKTPFENIIHTIKFGKNNTIELGRNTNERRYNSQFCIYNETTKKFKDYSSIKHFFDINFSNDTSGPSYVFSGRYNYLLKYNYNTNNFDSLYTFPEDKLPLPNHGLKLKNNKLFFRMPKGGFMIFDEVTKKIKIFSSENYDIEFKDKYIFSTFYTNRNSILIGTEKGLYEFDIESEKIINHSKLAGFRNATIYNIFEDNYTNIWFTLGSELVKLNTKNKKYDVFNKQLGFNNFQFSIMNYFIHTAYYGNYVFYPNKKGLTYFNVEELKLPNEKPIISIFETLVNDSIRNLDLNTIELKAIENNLSFHLITNQIYTPSTGKFSYQLIGLDDKIKILKNNEIELQNLSPGNYTLKIFYKNIFGIESDAYELKFTILKPFWKTWWFILLCTLLIVFILRLLIKKREKDLLKKQQQLENIVNERTAELVIRSKEIETQKHIIEEKQKETIDSIKYAQRIQNALLASKTLLNKHLKNYFIYFNPKDLVSGDFYWASEINNKFYFIVADSTGHGIPGAFMSLLNINFLNEAINEKLIENPSEILDYVRTKLIQGLAEDGSEEGGKDGMDCSLVCIDFIKMEFTYSCANNPIIYISNNTIIELEANRMPVGKSPKDTVKFKNNTIKYHNGDIFYLFTDGYADQFGGEKGKKLKHKNLRDYLFKIHQTSILEQKELLSREFNQWKGNLEQIDDVCVVGIKI